MIDSRNISFLTEKEPPFLKLSSPEYLSLKYCEMKVKLFGTKLETAM